MKKILLVTITTLLPTLAFPLSIRVNVDVNIMNGDGTMNTGNDNQTEDSKENSGSTREDSSSNDKTSSTQNG